MAGKKEVIITTNCSNQATYWQNKLNAHVVYEDWPGGAGNGLGTLYALQRAGLVEALKEGAAISLYHTAGKGTRLAPLPGSEWNNKSAVLLPNGKTLLESVIEETQTLSWPGRLSVFWGDQLFFPTKPLEEPTGDVSIFAKVQDAPTRKQWEEEHLERYGLLLLGSSNRLLEKIDYDTFAAQSHSDKIGISLGSFSLSAPCVETLLTTHIEELQTKKGRQDTDRDWWMSGQFELEVIDIGQDATWWDFGNLAAFHRSCLAMGPAHTHCDIEEADIENSVLINVSAKKVYARNAVIINASAPELHLTDSVLYNATDNKPIALSQSARADAHGMAFIAPLDGAPWETALPENPLSFADLYALNAR